MIASVRGRLIGKGKDSVVIEANGVGYRVVVPQRVLSEWGAPGPEILLYTHLHVRENELALYGCDTEEELELFKLLLGVTGVGPKAAMSMLSELAPQTLRQAIACEDVAVLARVPGIGPKTAKKIAFHLKDRFPEGEASGLVPAGRRAWEDEVAAALTALGYTLVEARSAVATLPSEDLEFEERLRLALRYFAR
jgi:Holliday junction DNA helicase RuvA